ncbi:MAG TPA: ABC transporter substrate-binding protein, partial [Chloroflexota bacterium]|nr:ABC transporter substrate-binding protein [Chloroflexota bacterium]
MAARVLALVLLLVACRPILPTPAPTATPPRPRHNPADTIVVGLPTEPTTLAAPPADSESARLVGQLLFAQLVGLDGQLAPRADLAEAVPTLENGGATWIGDGDARQLQVTFKLRPGARWSDGQPVTARDVVFTWQLALNPTLGGAIDTERRLEKVEAPDDATAVFTFFSERSARAAAARQPNRYGFLRDQQGPVVDPLYAFGLPDWWVYPAHALG